MSGFSNGMRAVLRVGLATLPLFGLARAATAEPAPAPSVSASASAPSPPKTAIPTRKPRPEPTEVEVIDLSPEGDTQAFALGAQVGGGLLGVSGGGPIQATTNVALVGEFGLGPSGVRVPWTLEPWLAFAMPLNALVSSRGYPSRFTELGARAVYRFSEGSTLGHQWFSFGLGAVWSNTKPSSGRFDPQRRCFGDPAVAEAAGLDCSFSGAIAPGLLVDLGFGIHETVIRRARWGFGVRVPLQISAHPGFGVFGFFYAQVGTAR